MASQSGTQQLLSNKLNLLDKYKRQDKRLKWVVSIASVVIVLLIILLGFATDWTRGLRKDKTTLGNTPIASTLGSTSDTALNTAGTSGTTNSGSTSDTTHHTTSTTTNTTTNNTTTSTTPPNPGSGTPTSPDPLLSLYSDTAPGDSVNNTIHLASSLGLGSDCSTDVLIQTCTFNAGSRSVTTKNLLGTGLVSSVTKNF
ncbi:MAG TPA: hypothetical protein VLG92_02240 [Candidatus Saccharimonadia bacterium]|nr:hypothetical protein [Candidatus Saccharimonadia bacterium]